MRELNPPLQLTRPECYRHTHDTEELRLPFLTNGSKAGTVGPGGSGGNRTQSSHAYQACVLNHSTTLPKTFVWTEGIEPPNSPNLNRLRLPFRHVHNLLVLSDAYSSPFIYCPGSLVRAAKPRLSNQCLGRDHHMSDERPTGAQVGSRTQKHGA